MIWYGQRGRWELLNVRELFAYRDVLWSLMLRDLKVQYRQTIIGVAWAVLRPVTLMIIFTSLFRLLGRLPAEDPGTYVVSLYAGLLPWQLFASSVAKSTSSLVANEAILSKVYFPRIIFPLIPLGVSLVDFAVSLSVLGMMMAWYQIVPSAGLMATPIFILLTLIASVALSSWLSAANALYRDVEYAVPFVLQAGMFVSPVVYEMNAVVPEGWRWLYSLNPLVGPLEGFRWSLLGHPSPPVNSIVLSTMVSLSMLIGGLIYFRHVERTVADRI